MRFTTYSVWLAGLLMGNPIAQAGPDATPPIAAIAGSEARDAYEEIVPTPVEPPDGVWQSGDRVRLIRRGTDGESVYTRLTTYERTPGGRWAVSENRVTRVRCDGKCPEPPAARI